MNHDFDYGDEQRLAKLHVPKPRFHFRWLLLVGGFWLTVLLAYALLTRGL